MTPLVILAGGGTGGHVFPMVAVADALRNEADVRVVYVGTVRGIESRIVPARGDELELLDILPIKGRGPIGALRGVLRAAGVLPRARALLRRLSPHAVLAAGGYAAGPVGLAAWLGRVPLAVLEPNSVIGLSNRWLMPLARRAYIAFPAIDAKLRRGLARRTGIPLRGSFHATPYAPVSGQLRVLVLGGSQGAKALNEVVPSALARVAGRVGALTIVHQAGPDHDEEVRASYQALGIASATVVPFLDDVAAELSRADLVIERAGASSLGELCAIGRASILIPFPFAADDHQRKNAEALAATGAAVCIDQAHATVDRIAGDVLALFHDPARRVAMAEAAKEQGRPDAARDIAVDLLTLAGIPARSSTAAAPPVAEAAHV
jgi:UDP-N-acetylglucosamine--N-acetylmuramyl-(pentapeptide) pyrophosphoryl-undecaprenol N-acetylglucosamine transferase